MKLNFGKYRGQKIDDIAKTKEGYEYLQWLVKQDWLDPNLYDYITCVVEI